MVSVKAIQPSLRCAARLAREADVVGDDAGALASRFGSCAASWLLPLNVGAEITSLSPWQSLPMAENGLLGEIKRNIAPFFPSMGPRMKVSRRLRMLVGHQTLFDLLLQLFLVGHSKDLG